MRIFASESFLPVEILQVFSLVPTHLSYRQQVFQGVCRSRVTPDTDHRYDAVEQSLHLLSASNTTFQENICSCPVVATSLSSN